MKKIFFLQRPSHRLRQRETVEFCPSAVAVVSPIRSGSNSVELELSLKRRSLVQGVKNLVARKFFRFNQQSIYGDLNEADVVYTFGRLIRNTSVNYIVELDNPYVLTYYNVHQFRNQRETILRKLNAPNCRHIVCISEACKQNLLQELGLGIQDKISVIYPYVKDCVVTQSGRTVQKATKFLFVANDFYLKGGRELLNVFQRINSNDFKAHLTMVTNLPIEYESFKKYSWLSVVRPGMRKSKLIEDYFLKADVLVHPTYQDSLGMVVLEATANGLPVISTRSYAIPELVPEGTHLINPPVEYYTDSFIANSDSWKTSFVQEIKSGIFVEFEERLEDSIRAYLDPNLRDNLSSAARKKFVDNFSTRVRLESFTKMIELACD